MKICQLVARFDLPANPQSYLQSRGRARMFNSHMLVLMEDGNQVEEEMVDRMVKYEAQLRSQALKNVATLQEVRLSRVYCPLARLQSSVA